MKAAGSMREQRLYPAFAGNVRFNANENGYHSRSVALYEAERMAFCLIKRRFLLDWKFVLRGRDKIAH